MLTQGEVQGVFEVAHNAQAIAQQAAQTTSKYEMEVAQMMHKVQ